MYLVCTTDILITIVRLTISFFTDFYYYYYYEMTQQKGESQKYKAAKIQLNSQAGRVPSTAAVLPH